MLHYVFLITNELMDATKNYNLRKFNKRRGFLKHLEFDEKIKHVYDDA